MFTFKSKPKEHRCQYQPNSPLPDNIKAFRTITMFLSQIQATQHLSVAAIDVKSTERNEARISDAFAQLAVAENDVVAFSTKPPSEPNTVHMLACTNLPGGQASEDLPPRTFLDFLFSRNPRKDDPDQVGRSTIPTVISPEMPDDIGADEGVIDYLERLDERW